MYIKTFGKCCVRDASGTSYLLKSRIDYFVGQNNEQILAWYLLDSVYCVLVKRANIFGYKEATSMKTKCIAVVIRLVLVLGAIQTTALAAPDPTVQLKPFVAEVIEILRSNDEGEERGDAVERIMEVAKKGFDFNEMSKRVLGKHWRKLSSGERQEFVGLFTELLKYTYVSQMENYSNQQVEFGKQRVKGRKAQVNTMLVDGAKKIPVFYVMHLKNEQWMVYDIIVEGVSLVRNYLEQFQEILRKEGFASLTRQLKTKIAEFQNEKTVG
ncbi:MAG: hypothetical protein CSB34_01600 [Desulfobulbus propionicus]|nr:MAG: hypothetical protein CSB34_01600 [Desulfobulbus propionicus]PIE63979.1 MAG: hypothetical protein CSA26_10375 [Desulfobacterales bacterium]